MLHRIPTAVCYRYIITLLLLFTSKRKIIPLGVV